MANRITIPSLKAQITPLRLPDIDIERNPYATVAASAAELGRAVETADARAQQAAAIAAQLKQDAGPGPDDDGGPPDSPPPRKAAPGLYDWGLIRFHSFDDYLRRQADERRRQRRASVWETLDDLSDSAFKDPSRIEEYRDDADGVLDTLPEEEREDYAAARRRINEQYFRGLIRDNPKLALETLRSRAGAAEEELGITEEMREDLEARAERAFEAEQSRHELERQVGTLGVAVWTKTYAKEAPREAWRAYSDVIDAFDWDGESVHWLEPRMDKTVREARALARAAAKTASKIITGEPGSWDRSERVRALDTFARSVIGPDAWATPTRHRMTWLSRIANRAPDVVREHIRIGVHSRDAGKRAFAGWLLVDLDDRLLDWAAPDIRAFGFDFGALVGAGFSDHVAVTRIEAAKTLTHEGQESRGRIFHARLDGSALSDALNDILEIDEGGLLYRPEREGVFEGRGPDTQDGSAKIVELEYGGPDGGTISGGVTPGPSGRDRRRYNDQDLKIIANYRGPIQDTAKKLGVSETAIAGCIAEELDDARRRGPLEGVQSFFKNRILEGKTHDDIASDYDAWERELARNPSAGDPSTGWGGLIDLVVTGDTKRRYPATLDLGHGKIRLHTAIRMLREYNERYPDSDPLGLKKYNNAYDVLVRDLETASAPTTAAFAGLMVEEATRWFESKISERWATMAQEDRDALIVEYYNQGRERIRRKYEEDMRRDGTYTPEPGESGKRHRFNAGLIRQQLYQ